MLAIVTPPIPLVAFVPLLGLAYVGAITVAVLVGKALVNGALKLKR